MHFECPLNNIYLTKKNKIKFKHHCAMCMRCSFYCPKNAIKIGFLEKWKVNGDYALNEIEMNNTLPLPYITENSTGFYKCFIKSFNDINRWHDEIKTNENNNIDTQDYLTLKNEAK